MKTFFKKMQWTIAAVFVLVFSYIVLANSGGAKKMIYVEGFTKGSETEIRVNDIPLGTIALNGQMFAKQVERHVLPGKNTLSIHPTTESGSSAIRLSLYPEDAFVDGKGGEEIGRTQTANGKVATLEFELDNNRPQWQWVDADIVTTAADIKDAEKFAKKAYGYLANTDAEHFTPLLKPLFEDMATHDATISAKNRLEGFKTKLKTRKGQPIWQFTNIDDIDIVLTPVANGRLINISRKDGSPLFRTAQESRSERISYYNIIGRKEGEWAFYY